MHLGKRPRAQEVTDMQTKGFWQSRHEARREAARQRAEAKRLAAEHRAKRREERILMLKKYGDVISVSVGTGIIAAVLCAIGTHLTRGTWAYASSLEEHGYPPLWVWAGIGAAAATIGVLMRRR